MASKKSPLLRFSSLLVLAAYLLLTILMTWPTALHLTDGLPGDGFDGWQNYWNMWWVREALLVLRQSPYFTTYLYPPDGANLLFHTLNIFNSLLTLPLQLNFGLAAAYNFVVFFSFVFAGYGGYLLSLYTLRQLKWNNKGLRLSAFVGGLVFTMSPFHMAHLLGHMQVFSMVWPPFYVLWLLRALKPWDDTPPSFSWRNTTLTCLFLILAALVDWYHALYLLIFTGLVVAWSITYQVAGSKVASSKVASSETDTVIRNIQRVRCTQYVIRNTLYVLRPLLPVLLIFLGFVLALSPLLIPMVREARARPDLDTGLVQNLTLSADLLAFFLPSEMHPLWGAWAKSIANNFSSTTSERLIFAGFTPLALGLYIIIKNWRSRIVKFWALIVAAFFILALGPYLHVLGQIVAIGDWPLPMPYLLLYKTVPFIGLTRSLSRYDLMVMLGLGVLAAMAHFSLFTSYFSLLKLRSSLLSLLSPLLVILLICFEFLAVPYPISKIEIPQFYTDLAAQPGDFTIAELPMNWDRPTPLLHQTVHHKRLLTAYTSRNNPRELAWRAPVLQHWRYLSADIIDQPLNLVAPTILADFNLRYIVLDTWQMPPGPERDATEKWVAAALPNAAPVYDDGRLKVYQAPALTQQAPYLSLGQGWRDRQTDTTGSVNRAFAGQADLLLHHPPQGVLGLDMTAAAPVSTALTLLDAQSQPVSHCLVTPTPSTCTLVVPPQPGAVITLTLQTDPAASVMVSRLSLQANE